MCVPAGWQLKRGGIDSAAGSFRAPGLSVSYDFGRYSDPLPLPAEATEASEAPVMVDGHPGRKVAYTLQTSRYVGLHVPSLRSASTGSTMRLTLLAQATGETRLDDAAAAFSTVRFKP